MIAGSTGCSVFVIVTLKTERTEQVMQEFAGGKVLLEKDGPVTIVTINRPEVRNACDMETIKALYDLFLDFESDESAAVGILRGQGDWFCSGGDLQEIATGASVNFAWAGKDKGLTRRRLNKPVLAAIEGPCVAGGIGLGTWCDMRICSETAIFGVYNRRFGGPMGNAATVRLPRIIGESRALDMMMTGRPVKADEALLWGLADRVVPAGTALSATKELAHQLAQFPQTALRCDRFSTLHQWEYSEIEAIDREIDGAQDAFNNSYQTGAKNFVKGAGRHGKF
jgi:enoyl-CoA hydratase/carnithine racemase